MPVPRVWIIFSGNIRSNSVFNTNELTIEEIASVDPNALIKELENKN